MKHALTTFFFLLAITCTTILTGKAAEAGYYNTPADPVDILIKRTMKNPQADELRSALPKKQAAKTKPLGS